MMSHFYVGVRRVAVQNPNRENLSLSLSFVMEATISATLNTRIISQKKSSEEIVSKRISILSLCLLAVLLTRTLSLFLITGGTHQRWTAFVGAASVARCHHLSKTSNVVEMLGGNYVQIR
jgi:hypothetical protein